MTGPGVGQTLWLRARGLEPGWYRLHQVANEGDVAAGIFEVVEGEVDLAPVAAVDAEHLSIKPALVPAGGGPVSVGFVATGEAAGSSVLFQRRVEELAPVARLERWDSGRWVLVDVLPLGPWAVPGIGGQALTLPVPPGVGGQGPTLPALEPGSYRLGRDATGGEPVTGNFWVVEGT